MNAAPLPVVPGKGAPFLVEYRLDGDDDVAKRFTVVRGENEADARLVLAWKWPGRKVRLLDCTPCPERAS